MAFLRAGYRVPGAGCFHPPGTRHAVRGTISLARRFFDDLFHVPPLPLRERAGLLDDHPIADTDVRTLVVREELARPPDVLLIAGVLGQVLDPDHDGLVHLVRDNDADFGLR